MTKWLQMKSAGAGGPCPAAGCARLGRGSLPPAGSGGKRALSGPRSWLFEMGKCLVWLRRPHVTQAAMNRKMTKMAANEKRGRRRGPVPQWDMRGLAAAACRPPNPRKTDPQRPALLVFGDGKAPCLAAPAPCHAGSYEPGNDKNGCKRKARAQEGPCPTAGCARLGRSSLPPKQLPVKAADFSFTAGNLAEALNPFFIFDKIQEGKSKHRPLSCKHN